MINLANLNIDAVYIGETSISSIYAGDKLVYSSSTEDMNGFIVITSKEDDNEISLQGYELDLHLVYSTNGKTWHPFEINTTVVTIDKDEIVYIGCTPGYTNYTFCNGAYDQSVHFTSTKAFDVSGNIMYLQSQTDIDELKSFCEFSYLFSSSHVNDASMLILSAATTIVQCYAGMFSNSDITKGPRIDASINGGDRRTNLDMSKMFMDCSNLTSINLPNLKNWNGDNYLTSSWVFGVASSGTFYCNAELPEEYGHSRIPTGWSRIESNCLTFTSKADDNVIGMKVGSSSSTLEFHLVYSTDKTTWNEFIPGTTTVTLNNEERMYLKCAEGYSNATFVYCQFTSTGAFDVAGNIMYLQSLTDVDELMSDDEFAYLFSDSMVEDASKLILPAKTLTDGCYADMFSHSTVTNGPSIEAVTGGFACMDTMFHSCSNIKTIMLPNITDWKTNVRFNCANWVSGVASSGTFYCNAELPEEYDSSHIPTGWARVVI